MGRKSLLKQSVRPCMPVRLFPTHKGSCCLGKQQKSLVGPLIMVALLSCGGVVASLGPGFSEISRLHLTRTQLWIICSLMISSEMQSMLVRKVGGRLCPRLWSLVPTPCFSTALAFYDGYRSKKLPANLIQAQRDYFGAHTYELLDNPGKYVHTNWTGTGGNVSSSTYTAWLRS